MAKVTGDGKLPKRIDDYSIYPLHGEMIVRRKSGFTPEKVKNEPKYALTRQNATEFGRVSSLCKKIRLALAGVLPKKDGLAVCNLLVRQMMQLIVLDGGSARGERQLWNAFSTTEAKELMAGYAFNPNGVLHKGIREHFCMDDAGNATFSGSRIAAELSFSDASDHIGIRLHHLDFDFIEGASVLCSSGWLFLSEDSSADHFLLECRFPEKPAGTVFSIIEIEFYNAVDGGFVPLADDGGKVACVIGCK